MNCGRGVRVKAALSVCTLAMLLVSVACFKAAPAQMGAPVSITLLPSDTALGPGQTTTVTADVYDATGQGATWTVAPFDFGGFTKESTTSATYTAPMTFSVATTVTITATSISDPTISSSVQVTVTPIIVSLSATASSISVPSAQTINQGGQLPVLANVLNDVSSRGVKWTLLPASGAGSLTGVTPFQVNYVAPNTVSSPVTVTVSASSVANPNIVANMQITVFPSGGGLNVALLEVNGGPVPGKVYPNAAFTSLTICKPNSTTACQTVSGILVDTGSSGLRILQSAIPLLNLPGLSDANGNTLQNCFSMPDGSYLWGPVLQSNIYIGGEIAAEENEGVTGVPTQVISDSPSVVVPDGCSNGGSNLNTPQLLGANGILGIGPEPTDCTLNGNNLCDGSTQSGNGTTQSGSGTTQPGPPPNIYYSCLPSGCLTTDSPVIVGDTQQVANPIPFFASFSPTGPDANGVIVDLPAAPSSEGSLQGRLIFGIGTEIDSTILDSADNSLGTATIFTMDAKDQFTTVFNGQTLSNSFIDSGANGLFFPSSLPSCTSSTQFFCPVAPTNLSAVNEGASQGKNTVDFSVGNADELFSSNPGDAVFGTLAGPSASSCASGSAACSFEWGLPFFYGRSVYTSISGQTVSGAPASPWWAY
jgi:hypothetical protein